MQLTITSSLQQTQFQYSQFTASQSSTSVVPMPPPQDRIELSDDARRPHNEEHSVGHVQKALHNRKDNPLFDFLKNVLGQITGAQINELKNLPAVDALSAIAPQGLQTSISAQQSSVSFETSSFSIDGSIATSDGTKLSFALDLQIMQASASVSSFNANSGPDGYNFSFDGSLAELYSTSFSFSFTAETSDGTPATGKGLGTFSLKDELKEVRHALKPLIKDFLKDSGMPSDKSSINQLLHTIA